jgi:TonB-dependent SusC/RagA subfamily outer membrane receptor
MVSTRYEGLVFAGLLAAFAATPEPAGAQGTITGRVADAVTHAPVPRAEVTVEGTALGTLTLQDGRFQLINVPGGSQQVRVRVVGYRPAVAQVTVQTGQTVPVSFELRAEVIALEEMVVTGLPTAARRRELGTSVSHINMAEVEARPAQSVESLLQASGPGIQSFQHEGQVGASGLLQLRGVKSVSQGNEPLVYVDGVRVATSRTPAAAAFDGRNTRVSSFSWNDINPSNIERVEIIKGAAATSLYGTEASAGVIQIFTKRGTEGKPQWSMDVTQGANLWPTPSSVIRQHETSLDIDVIKRTGHTQKYGASVRGGFGGIDYFLGGTASDENGIVDTQWSKNWSATGNFGLSLFEGATIRLSNSFSHRRTRQVPDGNNRYGYMINVLRVGTGYKAGDRDQSWVLEQEYFNEQDNFLGSLEVAYTHSRFKHSIRFGLHSLESASSGLQPFQWLLNPQGTISQRNVHNRLMTTEFASTWEQPVTSGVRSTLSVGGQLYDEQRNTLSADGQGFPGPGNHTVSSAAQRSSDESRIRQVNAGFFAQEVLGFGDRLFITGGVRVDGSSSFGENYGFQLYPKLSASFVASDASSWPGWWGTFRLRGAIGKAGKAPGAFDAVRTWEPISAKNGQPGLSPGNLGNPELGPERTTEWETGFDSEMFNGRLAIEFTYYQATTNAALFNVIPVPSEGFLSSQLENIGKLRSDGIELSVNLVPIDSRRFSWKVGGGVTTTNSKVLDMGGAAPFSTGNLAQIREGYAPPAFFGRTVTNPAELADPVFAANEFLGNVLPTLTVNMNTDVSIGALNLGAVGELVKGGHIVNSVAWLNSVRRVWPGCREVQVQDSLGNRASLTAAQRAQCLTGFIGADQFVESWDFFKLRNVSATFRVPSRLVPLGLGSATLSVAGHNLFKISDYTGIDPESHEGGGNVSYREDYYSLPPMRSVSAKLSFTF